MTTDCADRSIQHSHQGLPKDADCEAAVTDIINPTGKGRCAPGKRDARILETNGWFPPSRPRRGCEEC